MCPKSHSTQTTGCRLAFDDAEPLFHMLQLQLHVQQPVRKRDPFHIGPLQVQGCFRRSLHIVQILTIAIREGVGVTDLVNPEILRSRAQARWTCSAIVSGVEPLVLITSL